MSFLLVWISLPYYDYLFLFYNNSNIVINFLIINNRFFFFFAILTTLSPFKIVNISWKFTQAPFQIPKIIFTSKYSIWFAPGTLSHVSFETGLQFMPAVRYALGIKHTPVVNLETRNWLQYFNIKKIPAFQ